MKNMNDTKNGWRPDPNAPIWWVDDDLNEDNPMDERASIIAYITTLILNEWNHLRDTFQ